MRFKIDPNRFYLRVIAVACHDGVYFYQCGDLLQHSKDQPISFLHEDRAFFHRESLHTPYAVEVCKGSSLSSCYSIFRGLS